MSADQIVLDGAEIDLATLSRIAAGEGRITISDAAIDRVQAGRDSFLAALKDGQRIYGSTTGVGALKDVEQQGREMLEYTRSLPFAHQVAVGEEVHAGIVRLTMVLRLNSLLTGQVGVTVGFVRFLQQMLDRDLMPVMNVRGTAGAADLGQMGQLATVMAGEGMARLKGRAMPAAEAFAQAGMAPYTMQPREGLAAVATNSFGLAKAALYIIRAGRTLRREMALALTAAQAMGQNRDVWLAAEYNGLPQERWVARWLTTNSAGCDWPVSQRVHDPLSARMIAQIFGASANALLEAGNAVRAETAHVDDNPIVVAGRVVTSGGSLLLSLSMRLSSVQLALAHLARNAFNRCLLMVNGQLDGLPVNLVPPGVIATGYGPIMKLALEQVVRVTDASAPVSVLNQAVAAGLEDEAAFISLTAWRLAEQLDALDWLQAVEAILSAQALDLCGATPAPGVVARLYGETRKHVPTLTRDIPQSAGITAIREALCQPGLQADLLDLAPFSPFDDILGIAPGSELERNAATLPQQEQML
ncbi:aromatic amino acid lyase [Paracoccus xiamenensis]|uniref:aromatic amino acid lyase n=1 Tax=Paracoccus xiamenensis TaxID=2714901 RepID=UPI001407368B|nr:aromatic amino acid lyase [Paracoccus xiamenensis]NHF74331.1 aromatic amino acid lyase [Paracoccus xiamenensis]